MGVGAFFLLLIVLVVLILLGTGLYSLLMWLRARKLAPEEDKIEGPRLEREREQREHPDHLRVENDDSARFVGRR